MCEYKNKKKTSVDLVFSFSNQKSFEDSETFQKFVSQGLWTEYRSKFDLLIQSFPKLFWN